MYENQTKSTNINEHQRKSTKMKNNKSMKSTSTITPHSYQKIRGSLGGAAALPLHNAEGLFRGGVGGAAGLPNTMWKARSLEFSVVQQHSPRHSVEATVRGGLGERVNMKRLYNKANLEEA